jgi:hypothetical protein
MAECACVIECDKACDWCRVAPGVFISLKLVSQQAETNRRFPFQERRQPFHRRAQQSIDRDHDSRQPKKDRSPGGIHSCE